MFVAGVKKIFRCYSVHVYSKDLYMNLVVRSNFSNGNRIAKKIINKRHHFHISLSNSLDETPFKLARTVWCVRQDLIEDIPILYIVSIRHSHLWVFLHCWNIISVKFCNVLLNNFDVRCAILVIIIIITLK